MKGSTALANGQSQEIVCSWNTSKECVLQYTAWNG